MSEVLKAISERVEKVVREHFYPGPVAGSTSRLTEALIAEFALNTRPAQPDVAGLVEAENARLQKLAQAVVDSAWVVDAPTAGGDALSVNWDALESLRQALSAFSSSKEPG